MSPARENSTPEEPDDLVQESIAPADDEAPEADVTAQAPEQADVEAEVTDSAIADSEEVEPAPAKPARSRLVAEAAAPEAEDDEAAEAAAPEAEDDEAAEDEAAESEEAPVRARRAARAKTPSTPSKPKREAATAAYGLVDVDLPAAIFDARVNVPLIHQVVVAQQAAARQGTHSTKTRGEVRGGGRKPYRQKGTGRARQGSIRAPQFAGGGIVHGPVPRSHAQKTPKKMKAAALRGALSDRARHGLVEVVEGFVEGSEPRTRDALAVLRLATSDGTDRNVLVVAENSDQITWKSLRNAPGVHLIDPGQLNTYDVLVSDRVVFTTAALASFVARASRTDREDARL